MSEIPLCLSSAGLWTNRRTGERVAAEVSLSYEADGATQLDIRVHGEHTSTRYEPTPGRIIKEMHARMFDRGGGGGERSAPAEVVNIDGSSRGLIRDRWRAKWKAIESMAAD